MQEVPARLTPREFAGFQRLARKPVRNATTSIGSAVVRAAMAASRPSFQANRSSCQKPSATKSGSMTATIAVAQEAGSRNRANIFGSIPLAWRPSAGETPFFGLVLCTAARSTATLKIAKVSSAISGVSSPHSTTCCHTAG